MSYQHLSRQRSDSMLDSLKRLLSGQRPQAEKEARERELAVVQHSVKNSIQAVRSGRQIIETMSGMIELNNRSRSK